MVIADFYILCVGQKGKLKMKIPGASINTIYNNGKKKKILYGDRYKKVQKKNGIWYQISPFGRGDWYPKYDHEFFDLIFDDDLLGLKFLNISLKKDLLSFIDCLIHSSPEHCLYCFSDLQGYEEKYLEVTYETFVEMLQNELLCFNTVYRIIGE